MESTTISKGLHKDDDYFLEGFYDPKSKLVTLLQYNDCIVLDPEDLTGLVNYLKEIKELQDESC